MPKIGVNLKVAMLSQPFWLIALAPWPGLTWTKEYPPKTSSLSSDDFCAKSAKLEASTNKLASRIFRITDSSVTNRNSFASELDFPGAIDANDKLNPKWCERVL